MKYKINKAFIIGAFLLVCFFASCIYRRPIESKGFSNSDATYHVLLTMQAYDESSFNDHSFLPIQTFEGGTNKYINNGPSLIQDSNGNNFYVSFSPMGFYVPYLFCKILHLGLNANSLFIYNSLLMLLCAGLLAQLVYQLLGERKLSAIAFVAYIFIPEVLYTQGVVYWHHSLSQVFLILQLLIFSKLHMKSTEKKRVWQLLFLLVSFIYPYLEWTGFISNIGFALCIFIDGFSINKYSAKKLIYNHAATSKIVLLGTTTCAALGYYLWRFSKIATVQELITTLSSRAAYRSESKYTDLLSGYWDSYKTLIIFTMICVILSLLMKQPRSTLRRLLSSKSLVLLIVASFIPVFENVVMTEHAISYTFDRLKFAPFLIIVLSTSIKALWECKKKILNTGIIAAMIIVSFWGISAYDDNKFVDFGDGYKNSLVLRDYLNENYLNNNRAILVKRGWRAWGYLQTMYHRNIYCTDLYPEQSLIGEAENRGCQEIIYLTEGAACWDTGVYDYAEVYDISSGRVTEVSSQNGEIEAKEKTTIVAS